MERCKPVLLYPFVKEGSGVRYLLPTSYVHVSMPYELAADVAMACNGVTLLENVRQELSKRWHSRSIVAAVRALLKHGILCDSRNISPFLWRTVSNPTTWTRDWTPEQAAQLALNNPEAVPGGEVAIALPSRSSFEKVLALRSSTRTFPGTAADLSDISRALWCGFGTNGEPIEFERGSLLRRTVPSAGALFTSRIYLCLFARSGHLAARVYSVGSEEKVVNLKRMSASIEEIRWSFLDQTILDTAAGLIVICGDVARSTSKYANRGILYSILEAGHVAQNCLTSFSESRVPCVEIGGFEESRLGTALQLPEGTVVLTTVIFGGKAGGRTITRPPIRLEDVVQSTRVEQRTVKGYRTSFWMAFSSVNTHSGNGVHWSCGRDGRKKQAVIKARAEAIERYAAGRPMSADVRYASLRELGGKAVDPRTMLTYLPSQLQKQEHVAPFDPERQYAWCLAKELDARHGCRYVLADLVFYPWSPPYKRYAFGNSSGMASGMSVNRAIRGATLELIERDAFMVTWLNRLERERVRLSSLPHDVLRQVRRLEACGLRVHVVNLTLDTCPVLIVTVRHVRKAFFTCSAAADTDAGQALRHALQECEGAWACYLRDGPSNRTVRPAVVWETDDHRDLYQHPTAIKRARFLEGKHGSTCEFSSIEQKGVSFRSLLARLKSRGIIPLWVDLTGTNRTGRLPYNVVRVFLPGFVPLTFETGLEPLGMPRLRALPVELGLLKNARTVAGLNRFPHPYD